MGWGLNSLLQLGNGGLNASQAAIQTTGNNISNVNTPGYSRQIVRLEERRPINERVGQVGQGVNATEVVRSFDRFVESAYLDKATLQRRYEEQYSLLRNVEGVFNESEGTGISSVLSDFYDAWLKLAQESDSHAVRGALLEKAKTLATALSSADKTLSELEERMDGMIRQEVNTANQLIREIAALNNEINSYSGGRGNANTLLDARDAKVRQLAGILDIKVQNDESGKYTITTGSGMVLVQDGTPFSLSVEGPRTSDNLVKGSTYDGSVGFSGKDGSEYTVEIVKPGSVDSTGQVNPDEGTAQYRVSLDGGRTWIKDDQGNDMLFYATDEQHSAHVKDLDIYFTGTSGLKAGDKFVLSPKTDVCWVSSTGGTVNISTQIYPDGTDNQSRITGGTLGGYLEFRDARIGEYRDSLNAFTKTLIWEVNRIHSQGAGLTPLTNALGDVFVGNTDVALGSRSAGMPWFDRLQSGNMTFAVYDKETGKALIPYPGIEVFSPENFDPSKHSLEDVVKAINEGPGGQYLEAVIVNNGLQIKSKEGVAFSISADSTGLAAALGINTFFTGTGASGIGVRDDILADTNRINAGRMNGAGEGNSGDNIIAKELAALASKTVTIDIMGKRTVSDSISNFWSSVVTRVGADTAGIKFTAASEGAMANELHARREEISGVNLDEEMSNLIRFQSSYKAAAKLITTADQMFQTLLSLKN